MKNKGEGENLISNYSWFTDKEVINDFILAVEEIAVALPDKVKILGIGSGVGNLEYIIKEILEVKFGKSVELTLTDKIVENIEERNNATLLEVENKNLPFEDKTFDLVIARSVTHYEKDSIDENKVLNEVSRVLNKDGFFITEDVFLETKKKAELVSKIHSLVSKNMNLKTYEELLQIHKDNFNNVVLAKRQPEKELTVTRENFISRYEIGEREANKVVELITEYDPKLIPNIWTKDNNFGFSVKYNILICSN